MKKAFILFFLFITAAGYAQQQAKPVNGPRFKFHDSNLHDFGTIIMGVQAVYNFEFTNVGSEPLVITNAMASCGCTTPEWPKEPVLPGKSAKITVRYNSAGHPGSFSKTVFIYSNAISDPPGLYDLHIIGNVVKPGEQPKK